MKNVLVLAGFLITCISYSQDPCFGHFYNSEVFINPAWATQDSMDRVALKYRNQWPQFSESLISSTAYYSHYHPGLNGTSYFSYMHDNNRGILIDQRFSIGYAQKIKFNDFHIQPGLEFTYQYTTLDLNKLSFGNYIDPRRGFIYQDTAMELKGFSHAIDISAGILLNYKGMTGAYAIHHIPQPDLSLVEGSTSRLPLRHSVQALYKYTLDEDWQLTPYAFYQKQAGFNLLQLGLNIKFTKIEIGGIYTSSNLGGQIGYIGDHFNIVYSYQQEQSQLSNDYRLYAHELSLGYKFWAKEPHSNYYSF